MESNLTNIVHNWLSYFDIQVSRSYLNHKLSSHPSYPSILCITDLLDELGIENAALVTDKEKLNELPLPFLINANPKGTELLLVTDPGKFLIDRQDFLNHWDGIVVVMTKPVSFSDAENNTWLSRERRNSKLLRNSLLIISLITCIGISLEFSWLIIALLLTISGGIAVSVMVIQEELGISNDLTARLCAAGKNTDCNAVLQSRQGILSGWLNFSDLGIVWFSLLYLITTVSLFTGLLEHLLPVVSLLTLAVLPLSIVSLYYQRFVIKKWCPLCLITITIMWLQAGLLFHQVFSLIVGPDLWRITGMTGFIFAVLLSVWIILLKPLLMKNRDLAELNFRLQRFRFNPYVFETILQRKPPINTDVWPQDLQLGNPDSPIQILVACNPYCAPCARAHDILNELVIKRNIGLTIRYTLIINKDDKITQATEFILKLLKDKPILIKRRVMHDWYSHMNMDIFTKKYELPNETDVSEIMKQHETWTKQVSVRYTPTFFINGYQLPGAYNASDLPVLISGMINHMETKAEKKEMAKILTT